LYGIFKGLFQVFLQLYAESTTRYIFIMMEGDLHSSLRAQQQEKATQKPDLLPEFCDTSARREQSPNIPSIKVSVFPLHSNRASKRTFKDSKFPFF